MSNRERLDRPRRVWLKVVVQAAVAAPLGMLVTRAAAVQNGATRGALKYQDAPNGGKDCLGCAEFVPGKTPKDRGGCTVIPGDDEISPNGWCVMWEAKKKTS
jgi:High potential iron-sulfur protein